VASVTRRSLPVRGQRTTHARTRRSPTRRRVGRTAKPLSAAAVTPRKRRGIERTSMPVRWRERGSRTPRPEPGPETAHIDRKRTPWSGCVLPAPDWLPAAAGERGFPLRSRGSRVEPERTSRRACRQPGPMVICAERSCCKGSLDKTRPNGTFFPLSAFLNFLFLPGFAAASLFWS